MGLPLTPNREPDEFKKITEQVDLQRKTADSTESIKSIIAIHSGKGGVGKTFLTVNLAYALAEQGYSVGILDADVDCPNIGKFLGMTSRLHVNEKKQFIPVQHQGVKIVSMGLTREDEQEPFLIRGPAKHRVAIDLLTNTVWGALDFLFLDMPPGTADVPLSMYEFGNVQGILYVTSPQKEALLDTKKAIKLGNTFGIKALGLVENMSGEIFGKNTAQIVATEFSMPYLGSIPLSEKILAANERGDIIFQDVAFEKFSKPLVDVIREATHSP